METKQAAVTVTWREGWTLSYDDGGGHNVRLENGHGLVTDLKNIANWKDGNVGKVGNLASRPVCQFAQFAMFAHCAETFSVRRRHGGNFARSAPVKASGGLIFSTIGHLAPWVETGCASLGEAIAWAGTVMTR